MFEKLKLVMTKEIFPNCSDFCKDFHIYIDASDTQLGEVIMQDDKLVAFYSRKITDFQTKHTTIKRELLAVVETLK